jgi:NAD-specific glutamate dehydrogenase
MLKADSIIQLDRYHQLILFLTKDPYQPLDPSLEFLPSDEELLHRAKIQKGLARPELAIILAYSKIVMFKHLVNSCQEVGATTCQYFETEFNEQLLSSFPPLLQTQYEAAILKHPLAKEIVASVLSNEYINDVGPVYAFIGIALNDNDYWSSILTYKQMVYLFSPILPDLSPFEKVMLMSQMQLAHKRVNIHHITLPTIEQWLSLLPRYSATACLELSDRLASAHLTEQELSSFMEQFNTVAQALHFSEFNNLCVQTNCKKIYQMQALANVTDDFSKVIVDIAVRLIMSKQSVDLSKLVLDKKFESLTSTLTMLNAKGQSSIEFAMHYVKILPELVDLVLND